MHFNHTAIYRFILGLTIGLSMIIGSACDSDSDSVTQSTTTPSPTPTPTATPAPTATPTAKRQKDQVRKTTEENAARYVEPIAKPIVKPEDIKDLIVIPNKFEWYLYPITNPTFMDTFLGRTHYIIVRFTIRNKSDYKIEDFRVKFNWFGKSRTFIASHISDPILDIVPAKGRLTYTYEFKCDCKQAYSLAAYVSDFNITQ